MKNQKDIGKNTSNQETNKTLQQRLQKEEFHKNVLQLEDQAFINFFQKKNERIATAVYIITDFFPEDEPLKWQLRSSCIEVLRPNHIKDKKKRASTYSLIERKQFLYDLSSLWNLSYYAGYLSDMNFEVVKQELLSLFWLVEAREKEVDSVSIPESFFTLDTFQPSRDFSGGEGSEASASRHQEENPVLRNLSESNRKGHLWDMDDKFFKDIKRATKTEWQERAENFYKSNADEARSVLSFMTDGYEEGEDQALETKKHEEPYKGYERSSYQSPTSSFQTKKPAKQKKASSPRVVKKPQQKRAPKKTQQKSNDRRVTILEVIGKKGKVSVKDISNVIQNVSEKTLQRELTAMVNEGVLKKEGERRWSRYSIRA